jgi:high-affinity iron transporter
MFQILPGFIVGLREGLEAFLIVTLILDYLNKLGKKDLHSSVKKGMFFGLGISVVFGLILWIVSTTLSRGNAAVGKLWESLASFAALLFISYFIYWMIQHGKTLVQDIKSSVESDLSSKGLFLLSSVVVAREGAEIALFAFTAENKVVYLSGNLSGILFAAVLAFLIYKSLVKVDVGLIFRITLLYLILQAAYLFGYAIHELLSALKTIEFLSADAVIFTKLYDFSNTILDHKKGWLGIALNVLVGWYSKPEIIQAAVQITYAGVLGTIWKRANYKK